MLLSKAAAFQGRAYVMHRQYFKILSFILNSSLRRFEVCGGIGLLRPGHQAMRIMYIMLNRECMANSQDFPCWRTQLGESPFPDTACLGKTPN